MNRFSHPLIIGAGRSGLAAARLLLEHGAEVTLFDDHPAQKLRYWASSGLGEHPKLFCAFNQPLIDLKMSVSAVILSPGVPLTHPLVLKAQARGLPILNEIEVALSFKPHLKIIGITGTNGKSTATVMMESILEHAGLRVRAGGNLGTPLCDLITDNDFDYLVLELSSFQLETLRQIKLDAAIILNITPDHLDRYASMEAYTNAKLAIIDLVKAEGQVVLNQSLDYSRRPHRGSAGSKGEHYFTTDHWGQGPWDFLKQVNIKGLHNQENALAAAMTSISLGINQQAIIDGLNTFKPLEFRCQLIGQKNGLSFVNDSKGTTVVAVEKALSGTEGPVHLLLGGQDKGESFASLSLFPQVAGFYIYGRSQTKIFSELKDPRAQCFSDLSESFQAALKQAKPGSTILLSPGCASFDQFSDYAERGKLFNTLVSMYLG